MLLTALIAILCGYLLGSFPSAIVVGLLWGHKNLLDQGDGHIGATAAYRTMGRIPFVIVTLSDGAKGIGAVFLASALSDGSVAVMCATAYAAVIGHCWSVYIRFKGGLGAVVTYGVLLAAISGAGRTFPWAFIYGAAVAVPVMLVTRRSTLSTYVLLATTSVSLWTQHAANVLVLLPVALIIIPQIKRIQAHKSDAESGFHNDLAKDLKRPR
jgi:acyl phosphate:glycerol-3-phosphate acyltransferase